MNNDDFLEYDDYEDEVPEIEKPLLDDMELFRLSNVAESTKKGYADQGFPNIMRRLAAHRFVTPVDKGYKITNEGLLYLQKYKLKLRTI